MIPGDLLSAFPHRQFHTLPGSRAALPNSNPNACVPMLGGSLYHFCDGLSFDPAERRTHGLPCERRTRYRLSQPDTVLFGLYTIIPMPSNPTMNMLLIIVLIFELGKARPNTGTIFVCMRQPMSTYRVWMTA